MMGMVEKELENLEKDSEKRKSAMEALKSYVRDLDTKAIPFFLAKVSETKETGDSSGEYTISLFEVLARVHGPKILPHIDNTISTIIKTLKSSAGSTALHQACSKVVPAVARYGIDPTTSEEKKQYIIYSLTKPLSDSLLATHESLSSGAALCLKALVDSDNWRFASNEIANEVCQTVAGALEKHKQMSSHMKLVISLAKHNSLILEPYARLLVQSGLQVLKNGEGDSKRLLAVHMITSLMRYLDPRSLISELEMVIEELVLCQSDKISYVRGAASEALQLAKRIRAEKGSRNMCEFDEDLLLLTAPPESQTVVDHLLDSLNRSSQGSVSRKSVNRRLWARSENGSSDVSLKDGIFPQVAPRFGFQSSELDEFSSNGRNYDDEFAECFPGSVRNGFARSRTHSPQRSCSHITPNNSSIFTTPRKLIRSLQDTDNNSFDLDDSLGRNTPRRFVSPSSCKGNGGTSSVESSESHRSLGLSQSSTVDFDDDDAFADAETECFTKVVTESRMKSQQNSKCRMIFGLSILVIAMFVFLLLGEDQDRTYYNLVPT